MRYFLGSSFFQGGRGGATKRQLFSVDWHRNNQKVSPAPSRTVVVCEGGSSLGFVDPGVDVIRLTGDLGYCGQLLSGEKKNLFSSWSASMLALAMLAYDDEADFVYKESDCLAFGPWIRKMYEDMGDGEIVFGPKHTSAPWMPASQSLFLVRHRWIPMFVQSYLGMGTDGDPQNLGEAKFQRLEERFGTDKVRRLSFGFDRCRPIQYEDHVFYVQQISDEEMDELRRRELI